MAETPPREPPNYLALLERIHRYLTPRTYVEIGVFKGFSFARVLPGTLAVGIDPRLRLLQPVNRSAKFFPLKSDEFFEKHDLRAVLDGNPVDLAFIDGRHLFEFALRDFMHLERFCGGRSTILIHDCNPGDREMAVRDKAPGEGAWTGDVWKLIPCLKQYRPDLDVSVVDSPPTGLGIVTGLDPASSVIEDGYAEILQAFIDLDYSVLEVGRQEKLNLIPNKWDLVRSLLPVSDS